MAARSYRRQSMKRLPFTFSVLLCLAVNAAQPVDHGLEKELEKRERQRLVEQARTGDGEARLLAYLDFTGQIRKGDSAAQITDKLSPPWVAINTNKFIREGYFAQWVPWTNRAHVLEWRSESSGRQWPMVVFGLFSDARKTNLVDALLYMDDQYLLPLVDGPYSRKVLAVKPGETMEKVFKELGRRDCQYYKDKDGKWRVRVLYHTYKGNLIFYEAEAATGIILRVWDGTI
jgi:hypothetical protein